MHGMADGQLVHLKPGVSWVSARSDAGVELSHKVREAS